MQGVFNMQSDQRKRSFARGTASDTHVDAEANGCEASSTRRENTCVRMGHSILYMRMQG